MENREFGRLADLDRCLRISSALSNRFEGGPVSSFVMLHVNFTLPSGQVQLVNICDNLLVTSLDGVAKRHG